MGTDLPYRAVTRRSSIEHDFNQHYGKERRRCMYLPTAPMTPLLPSGVRCKGLSEVCMPPREQKGLGRAEVIRMLYECAELRGSYKSLDRYRYAKDAPAARAIYQRFIDQIDERHERA
ncbi:MAG: hypothetical protein ACLTGQ_10660 [Mediterraneibacter gnavus]